MKTEILETTLYELGQNGKMVKVDTNAFADLKPGTVLMWKGNSPRRVCILERKTGRFGTSYDCFRMDTPENNAYLINVKSHSIKDQNDLTLWRSQHYFVQPETVDADTLQEYWAAHFEQAAQREAENKAAQDESDRLEAAGRKLWAELIGDCPAVIIARLEKSECDHHTDYYGSTTQKTVILAPSKHTRNNFKEMRKAADILPETQHLGTGKGRFKPRVVFSDDVFDGVCYYKGQIAQIHGDLWKDDGYQDLVFETKEAAQAHIDNQGEPHDINFGEVTAPFEWEIWEDKIEHRENYSGGRGYYLGVDTYSGWQVLKRPFGSNGPERGDYINLAKHHDHLTGGKPAQPKPPARPDGPQSDHDNTPEVTHDRDWTWIKFGHKPADSVLDTLKTQFSARWGKRRGAWFIREHIEADVIMQALNAQPAASETQETGLTVYNQGTQQENRFSSVQKMMLDNFSDNMSKVTEVRNV